LSAVSLTAAGRHARHERLTALLERLGLGALVLRRSANFAWYTGGADNRVDHSSPFGAADVLVTHTAEYILTNNVEARRMRDEQTPQIEVIEYPWYEEARPAVTRVAGSVRLGADCEFPNAVDVTRAVAPLRYVLDADALARYRAHGPHARLALDEGLQRVAPGMRENEAAAEVAAAFRRRGFFTPVLLAGADERITRYRHPIPRNRPVERRLMVVACAERDGLYFNLTRIHNFREPSAKLRRLQAACDTILRRLREEATRPGRTLADAFADCQRFYAEAGFPDEWQRHHQGGLTGYASRELIATPATHEAIQVGQAFAWNPSVTGVKAEETFILTEAGPEIIAGNNAP
jgi:Xaa-Pro dipeptidase